MDVDYVGVKIAPRYYNNSDNMNSTPFDPFPVRGCEGRLEGDGLEVVEGGGLFGITYILANGEGKIQKIAPASIPSQTACACACACPILFL